MGWIIAVVAVVVLFVLVRSSFAKAEQLHASAERERDLERFELEVPGDAAMDHIWSMQRIVDFSNMTLVVYSRYMEHSDEPMDRLEAYTLKRTPKGAWKTKWNEALYREIEKRGKYEKRTDENFEASDKWFPVPDELAPTIETKYQRYVASARA